MKKYYSILVSLLMVPLFAVAQSYTRIINFDESDFSLETKGGYTFIYSNRHPVFFEGDTLLPGLPIIRVEIPIEDNQELCDFTIDFSERTIIADVTVAPSPKAVISGASTCPSPSISTHYTKAVYPDAQIQHVDTYRKYDQKFIAFNVRPFRYNAVQKTLSFLYRMELTYQLKSVTSSQPNNTRSASDNWDYLIVTNNSLKSTFVPLADWKT